MDWRNEQRQNALLCVFYMLVAMALLIVRSGLDSRSSLLLPQGAPPRDDAAIVTPLPPADFYPAALRLLCAAGAALRLLDAMTREAYELMKQAPARPARARAVTAASQCARPRKRLDSS